MPSGKSVTTLHLRLGGPAQSEVALETAAAVHDAAHVLPDRDRRRPATFFDILSFMARLTALIIASTVLGSCSGVSGGKVGDYAPEWLGGAPKDMPPRPGTPEYDAFRKKQEAEANRDKSKDPPRPKASPPMKGTPQ